MPTASRNKTLWVGCVVAFMLLLAVSARESAGAGPRDVLAHGSGRVTEEINPVWVVLAEQKDQQPLQTVVLLREQFGASDWEQLPPVPARTIAVTSHSNELVMLLENRNWAWFSGSSLSSRFSYGPALPERARVLALAGDRKSLWALGQPSLAATSPATTRSATAPAEMAAQPDSVRLYSLAGQSWKAWPEELPEERGGRPLLVSLVIIGEAPYVAASSGDQALRIHKYSPDAKSWSVVDSFQPEAAPEHLKLLNVRERPVLWIQSGQGIGQLRIGDRAVHLKLAGPMPRAEDIDLTAVGDHIRAYFRRDGKLYEQRYSSEGVADGEPALVTWSRPQLQPPIHWLTAVMAVLAVLLISSLLRRRSAAREKEQRQDGDDEG